MTGLSEEYREPRAQGPRFDSSTSRLIIGIPLLAILFQVYVPRFVPYLAISGTAAAGDGVFLADVAVADGRGAVRRGHRPGAGFALSHHPLGMFGIVKTLVGYFAASVSLRFDVEIPCCVWCWRFSFFSSMQFFYWVLARALLGDTSQFELAADLVLAVLNAVVAVSSVIICWIN